MPRTFAGVSTRTVCAVLATTIAARMQSVKPLTIPQGEGVPVVTDGIFKAGERDHALKFVVNDGVTLYLREHRGVVCVGARGGQPDGIGPTEVWLAGSDRVIRGPHVSFSLAARVDPVRPAARVDPIGTFRAPHKVGEAARPRWTLGIEDRGVP